MKKIINPFYLYIYVFVIILMLYSLHWSILLPDLSIELIVFLLITFILSLIYGLHIQKCRKSFFSNPFDVSINVNRRVVLLGILYVLEFLYAKRLPLLEILLGTEGFVHFGGIPTIHVLLVTYTVFFSTFIFHLNSATL